MKKPYDAKKYYNKEYYHGKVYVDYNEEHSRRRFNRVLDEVQNYKKTGRLLDVGCALGFLLKEARKRGFETAGVDVSKYAVKKASRYGKTFCVDLNKQKLPFNDNRFDVITMIDCVEHFEDPKKVVSEVKRVLRPGGFVFIETVNHNAIGRKIFGKNWAFYSDEYHLYPWVTKKKLKQWLFPLKVIDYWTFGCMLPFQSELGKAFLRSKAFIFLSGILFWRHSPAYNFFRATHADYWDSCWCVAKKQKA